MMFRMLQVSCFGVAVFVGATATKSAQAQYPFPSGPSCSGGYQQAYYGQQGAGYGHLGGYSSPGGNYVANYYGMQPSYAAQPPMGYGGYSQPAVNLNQSFYPDSNAYGSRQPQLPPHHSHHSNQSHHGWHLGHYLFGI